MQSVQCVCVYAFAYAYAYVLIHVSMCVCLSVHIRIWRERTVRGGMKRSGVGKFFIHASILHGKGSVRYNEHRRNLRSLISACHCEFRGAGEFASS